jgi:hypothetical protein
MVFTHAWHFFKKMHVNCEEVFNTNWCSSWRFGALGTEVFGSMKKMEGMANLCIFQQTPSGQMISTSVVLKFKLILGNVEQFVSNLCVVSNLKSTRANSY